MTALFTTFSFDGSSPVPLYRQLYDWLRGEILTGQLKRGTRLQSTRELAAEFGVSRNTVLCAFEQLLAEGYLEGKTGAGTFVSAALPDEMLSIHSIYPQRVAAAKRGRGLSKLGAEFAKTDIEQTAVLPLAASANHLSTAHASGQVRAFRSGTPAFDAFPVKLWSHIAARLWRNPLPELLGYSDAAGFEPLRVAIAEYLRSSRGVSCDAGQIVVTAGAQQALDLAARLLLNAGDEVWMEDPGYLGARAAFLSAGARLIPVPIDEEGLIVATGARLSPAARLAYVTPSHQYPTGVAMSLGRRLALLEWAARAEAWIIEDDYDSEYRYAGRPLPALQGLDKEARVLYVGTFSKVLFPALRVGYLVAPPDLMTAFIAARGILSRFTPSVEQAVIADFINEGHFARHIRKMRTLYAERQNAIVKAANYESAGLLEVRAHETGMHVTGYLPDGISDKKVAIAATAMGVDVQPLSLLCLGNNRQNGLLLGYAAYNERQIGAAMKRLTVAIQSVAAGNK